MEFAAVYYMVHCLVFFIADACWILYYFELVELCFYIAMCIYYGSEFVVALILSFSLSSMLGKKDFLLLLLWSFPILFSTVRGTFVLSRL